jgi:hypothetical protein
MRKRLASDPKSLHPRKREFAPISRDAWIIVNSDIEPQKLHALGVIKFRWNLSEHKLISLFGRIFPVDRALELLNRVRSAASVGSPITLG